MIKKRKSFVFTACIIFTLSIVLFNGGCQYDYSSPLPGTISIRLATKSANLEFNPLNNFVLKVTEVQALRNDFARAEIYEDIKAIGRTTNTYNTLDVRAKDSNLVMGEALLPPGDYIGINMLVQPGPNVTLDGYRVIPVLIAQEFKNGILLEFRSNFKIREGETTRIVVTLDLDNALVKGANNYYFEPSRPILAFRENFDSSSSGSSAAMGSLPSGWTRSIADDAPTSGAWGVRGDSSSQGYALASSRNDCYSSYTQGAGSWLQTPAIDASQINVSNPFNPISLPYIGFGMRFSAQSKSTVTLQVSKDPSFASFLSLSPLTSRNNSSWQFYSAALQPDYVGTSSFYVRWLVTGSGEQSDVRMDDIYLIGVRQSYYISSIQ